MRSFLAQLKRSACIAIPLLVFFPTLITRVPWSKPSATVFPPFEHASVQHRPRSAAKFDARERVSACHSFTVASSEPLTIRGNSGWKATQVTFAECPSNVWMQALFYLKFYEQKRIGAIVNVSYLIIPYFNWMVITARNDEWFQTIDAIAHSIHTFFMTFQTTNRFRQI